MTEEIQTNRLHLGAAYYPEHWSEEHWAEDIRLMCEAGLSVVRMGEFAWSTFEPAEGEYHFDWLERAIEMLYENGIASILGTPTAAPPAWLTYAHPDTLAVDEFGRKVQHGNRCHYCVTSPEYHAACGRIVTAMAEYFGPNPHVIGWQLDNEYNKFCYCPRCRDQFQRFLADRYGSLEALNERWSTSYWSQTYSAWEQIPIPIGGHNPGLMLEWKRFNTHCYRQFQRLQLDVLRPHLQPGVWVTHNFMGWYDGYDHYQMAEDLDLASWDYYIGTGHHDYVRHGAIHDLTYGFKRKNFWVMETQPGTVNWSTVNNVLNKGEARTMVWQAVGHGAEGVLYWQWRSALGGQEQYHGTLVDQSGRPRPFYEEVQQIGKEFTTIADLLAGSKSEAKVAIINDYESRWSIQWQRHHQDFDYVAHLNHYYKAFATLNIPVDIISPETSLAGYRIVVAPALLILEEKRLELLRQYIHRGSCLILGARSGMKDPYNALLPARQPGALVELTGVEVEEYYALREPVPVKGNWFSGTSEIWAERLRVADERATSVVARYGPGNGWLENQNAITVHVHGGIGLVYYLGCYLDDAAQLAFTERILKLRNVTAPLITPSGVEVCVRTNPQGEKIYIVINHEQVEKRIQIPWKAHEHLSGFPGSGELRLLPYSVVVLKRIEEKP